MQNLIIPSAILELLLFYWFPQLHHAVKRYQQSFLLLIDFSLRKLLARRQLLQRGAHHPPVAALGRHVAVTELLVDDQVFLGPEHRHRLIPRRPLETVQRAALVCLVDRAINIQRR